MKREEEEEEEGFILVVVVIEQECKLGKGATSNESIERNGVCKEAQLLRNTKSKKIYVVIISAH